MLLPEDAVNARKTGGGTCDTNGLVRDDKTRTEIDGGYPFLSCINAVSTLCCLKEKS